MTAPDPRREAVREAILRGATAQGVTPSDMAQFLLTYGTPNDNWCHALLTCYGHMDPNTPQEGLRDLVKSLQQEARRAARALARDVFRPVPDTPAELLALGE
jgi:hypothetical protein